MKRPKGPSSLKSRVITVERGGYRWVGWWDRWRGMSPLVPVALGELLQLTAEQWKFRWEIGMKKPESFPRLVEGEVAPHAPSRTLLKLTALNELLSAHAWEDGTVVGDRALMVFVSLQSVRVLVKVENPPLKASAVGADLDEALAAMDTLLRSGKVVWQQDDRPAAATRKKR